MDKSSAKVKAKSRKNKPDSIDSMIAKKTSMGVTAFIDILGFGARVLGAKSLGEVASISSQVETIRNQFDFESEDELIKKVHKMYKKKVLAFSDSVIVNFPISSVATKYEGTFDPIMSEISGFGMAQGNCVQRGLFIRGGVDLGWWYQSGKTLVSQSLTRAYYSEGNANVPVLALTDDLYAFLSEHSDRKFYSDSADPIVDTFRKYEGIAKGKDVSFWYVDYIRICIESIDWMSKSGLEAYKKASPESDERQSIIDDGYRRNVAAWLKNHASMIRCAYNTADEKCKSKYVWLAEYHNEYAKVYTKVDDCLCEL